ncbi:related to Replication factor A protein 2 [Saccharomycodes ludwigii]|uniref:Related to Replication factor A protein 2 n=1 Tax=Saccharomycodes ludwigii TaxID=36035 RepID=A0A376BA69_9ASCO|nr:hypothetical protein SCDLUD_005014 [Saccharomycodes ludwigii]KAH3898691.1 hypothetical protein SCDLUD_005014 [Saccharomycodes ludwigii]SSD61020.1 related to Replication factor A protein 2 [Saccharomycodes ludwigii]
MNNGYQPYNEYSTGGNSGGFDHNQNQQFNDSQQQRPGSNESGGFAESVTIKTLIPVTIKQLTDSKISVQDGPYLINNVELTNVCFVGVIRNIQDQTGSILLTIEDGTGQLDVKQWSNKTEDLMLAENDQDGNSNVGGSQLAQQYHLGTYVKVFGSPREFGGKMNVQYAVIRPVESYNEVIAHLLEAGKVHLIANNVIKTDSASTSATNNNNNNDNKQTTGESLFVSDIDDSNLSIPQKILNLMEKNRDNMSEGIPVKFIAKSLNILEDDVKLYCDSLADQGQIFTSYEDHYQLT